MTMDNPNPNWLDLLDGQTTDTTTVAVMARIQTMTIIAAGVFDGASVQLQVSADDVKDTVKYPTEDDANWVSLSDALFTAEAWVNIDLADVWIRAVQSGSVGDTSISLKLRPRNAGVATL